MGFVRGAFRVRGDVVDIFRSNDEKRAIRVEFFGDEIESLAEIDPLRGTRTQPLARTTGLPRRPLRHVASAAREALVTIRSELADPPRRTALEQPPRGGAAPGAAHALRPRDARGNGLLQRHRELLAAHGRAPSPGEPPHTLIDYFPRDFLFFIDESHVSLPQVRAMYNGDRSRKSNLVEYGFRLPSALDNRPLKFDEFEQRLGQDTLRLGHSLRLRTPAVGRHQSSSRSSAPPASSIRSSRFVPAIHQVEDLLEEVRKRVASERNERVPGHHAHQAHGRRPVGILQRNWACGCDTCTPTSTPSSARKSCATCGPGQVFDVLVGVNLLREGLDLPEVSLVGDPRRG